MNTEIKTYTVVEVEQFINANLAVLLYFNTMSCNVGESLAPKVAKLIKDEFPKIKVLTVDINFNPEIAAKYTAFVEPTILVFFEGKETIRKSRMVSIPELYQNIERIYKLIF